MIKNYRLHIFFLFSGAITGYFVLHPYTMLVSSIMHVPQDGGIHWNWKNLFGIALTTFKPTMSPMAVAFILFSGIIGFMIGIIVDRGKKLYEAKHKNEKKKVALETLNRLMVTLSHYLLNANMIIGGKVRHIRKVESNEDTLDSLEVIEEQAKKIDAVIRSLKKITEIKTADYTNKGHGLMIDITKEMEEELNKTRE